MTGPTEIAVWQGEIADLEVDAIVIGSPESLFMTGGPAASVKRLGGIGIESAAVAQGPITPGQAIVTAGGQLAAPYVIHAVAVGHNRVADPDHLRSALRAALAFCEPLQLHRIAMAPLGMEFGAFRAEDAAEVIVSTLVEPGGPPLESIVIAAPNAAQAGAIADALVRQRTRA